MLTDRNVCLLLGAGASQHLGFPLGAELCTRILTQIHSDGNNDPVINKMNADVQSLYNKLAFGGWTSPDAFLAAHPEHLIEGKYLIAKCLLQHEDRHLIASKSGWYGGVVSAIRAEDASQFVNNRLSIVTFNYDRSLDFKLHGYLMYGLGLESNEAWRLLTEVIPIVHVHGILGKYPEMPYGDNNSPLDASNDILVVHEATDGTPEFERASKMLHDADEVIVMGFGFGEDNVRRLRYFLEQESEDRKITVVDGGGRSPSQRGDREQWLKRWGINQTNSSITYHEGDCNGVFNAMPGLLKRR